MQSHPSECPRSQLTHHEVTEVSRGMSRSGSHRIGGHQDGRSSGRRSGHRTSLGGPNRHRAVRYSRCLRASLLPLFLPKLKVA